MRYYKLFSLIDGVNTILVVDAETRETACFKLGQKFPTAKSIRFNYIKGPFPNKLCQEENQKTNSGLL